MQTVVLGQATLGVALSRIARLHMVRPSMRMVAASMLHSGQIQALKSGISLPGMYLPTSEAATLTQVRGAPQSQIMVAVVITKTSSGI